MPIVSSLAADAGVYALSGNHFARLFIGEPVLSDRTVVVAAENRIVRVAAESRGVAALAETRSIEVQGETHGVP